MHQWVVGARPPASARWRAQALARVGLYFCPGRAASLLDAYPWSSPSEERSMREFGVRRYGNTLYHHCMADSAADAANWFAHFQTGIEGKDFQALVKDVARPVSDEAGIGGNPQVGVVRHRPLTPGGQAAVDFKRPSSLRWRLSSSFCCLRRPGAGPDGAKENAYFFRA